MSDSHSHKVVWERFIQGDENALLDIYQQHYLGLINYGRMIIDDREYVNDCFMDLLIRFWNKKETLPKVENVRSYLITSFRREILHKLDKEKKSEQRHQEFYRSGEQSQISYEEYIIRIQTDKGLKAKISKALDRLTPRQLELIRLKFFEDLDYDAIAIQCGITKRTAYNIIYDSLKILKDILYEEQNGGFHLNLDVIVGLACLNGL